MSGEDRIPGALVAVAIALAALVWMLVARLGGTLAGAEPREARRPDAAWPDMRVEINTCGSDELIVLPGVGPGLAERIVDDRATRGPFASVDDLARVDRVGPATIDRIRPFVVVD